MCPRSYGAVGGKRRRGGRQIPSFNGESVGRDVINPSKNPSKVKERRDA